MVNDVEDFVMHRSQVSCDLVSSVKLISRNNFNTHSGVCKIDNHTKYSMIKRGDKVRFYGYNARYGWNRLLTDVLDLISTVKAKIQVNTIIKKVYWIPAGNRIKYNDNESVEGENKLIPPRYQQGSYSLGSGCV